MTLRLILTRHAKSDWDNPLDTDHQRPLNTRGKRTAPLIGRWLAEKGYVPQEALVSDATRTRETWALLSAELPENVPAEFDSALYLAGPDVMLRVLQSASAPCVIMIGHNPGIADVAQSLLRTPLSDPDCKRYPTCATLIVDFDEESWRQVEFRTGTALDFILPRRLEAQKTNISK